MLKIKGLYKKHKNNVIKDVDINIDKNNSISIECNNDISDLLVDLILGRELPAKGEIYIEDIKNLNYVKSNIANIGIVPREDAFYDRMSIDEYMKFFVDLLCSELDYKEVMLKLALLDIGNKKIKNLNYSQKRRLSFGREILKQPKFLIFQEPILNMDRDGAKVIIENIEDLKSNGTAILITSVVFKDALMLSEKAYRLNDEGLVELDNSVDESKNDGEEVLNEKPVYKIEKIPAKLDERILLFDPIEIDYIESQQGVSNLNIRGDKFPCTISLADLEERLKYFGFFRCHRSYLVNLQRVKEVITWTRNSYSLSLDDKVKSSIPLSKRRLEELKNILKL
ncbi:LytTR family transcriptional regulator DNA-binding domain-containing protein [Clostridium sp. FAM 1755]|uniref:LytTR family transcriptional regulator DNA-binding domain-containing protein n=1 Tax=Clostridium TaxID=1485 RepID=UPI0013D2302B|nr:LytTR family transcriptional regulator DNA-binding domain-containing protein [Clostridium sporogenes]NFN87569.1 ATP-binding cassette domain-containing protein [Clostridium sporogenes]NFS24657.1 ATP-binding cassette domain-containing protein [Clostridium sporogenes]NFV13205.1 ATP-binding cassette domain-containing protein [Clostridium sporogenes]